MRYRITLFLTAIVLASHARADAWKDLEGQTRQSYEGKLLMLRNSCTEEVVDFDNDGTLLGKCDPGPWTMDSMLLVKKISFKNDSVKIEGWRVIVVLRLDQGKAVNPLATTFPIAINLKVSLQAKSDVGLKALLFKIFTPERLEERFNASWKPLISDQDEKVLNNKPKGIYGILDGTRPVFFLEKDVVEPPKPIFQPDPEYTENARANRVQGVVIVGAVINERGQPEILKLIQPLERSLDAQALSSISRWKFRPAVKDAKPVPCRITIEIDFHLK